MSPTLSDLILVPTRPAILDLRAILGTLTVEEVYAAHETFAQKVAEVSAGDPDVVIMELADGLLQRETAMLLAEAEIQRAGRGVVFTAENSLSALSGTERLRQLGHRVIAVSGKFTSSPLAMREYCQNDSAVPVLSSAGKGEELSARVRSFLRDE